MSGVDHQVAQLADAVAGEPKRTYADARVAARDLVALSDEMHALALKMRGFVERATPFFEQQNPEKEIIAGCIKRVRAIGEDADAMRKLFDTGISPLSLRSLLEYRLAISMLFEAQKQGSPCVVRVGGKKFVASAETKPTIPDPKKNPTQFQELLTFLTEKGHGDIIRPGVELKYREVAATLESLLATKGEMLPPWPDFLKVSTTPTIRMSDDTKTED